ncbi:MAG: Holliday junction branch migration protein RuvA [Ignavibacteria bacterium]|nr:Holliday junction branch migration protein RuvA [Ignavibacteria bacterium]
MIATLTGALTHKSPTEVVMDVNGVGYGVSIPISTFEVLGEANSAVTLFIHLYVREDTLQLYGFATEEERDTFRMLISVSGIGPKMAQGVLSGITVSEFKRQVTQGNLGALTAIPGVGKKLAERLVLELRDKVGKPEFATPAGIPATDPQSRIHSETLLGLISLGYTRVAAEKALRAAIRETNGRDVTIEELIKASLRQAGK